MFTLPFDLLIIFTVISPVIGWISPKLHRPKLVGLFTTIALAVTGFALIGLYNDVNLASNNVVYLPENSPFASHLRVDMLSIFMMSIFLGLGFAATIYSIAYIEKSNRTPYYYTLILSLISGMVGIVFAGDLLTLFVFWELMSISSYALVSFFREKWASVEAGFKFLVMSAAGSATALFGISLLYGLTGTLSFEGISAALGATTSTVWVFVAGIFIFIGFGVKTAVVPLHTWLPDAYSAAPSPVSAILSGIVIGPGIYAIAKMFFSAFISIQTDWMPIFVILSLITMFLGNITALMQTDLKRMLAYSSIGQVGYMLVGLAVGTQTGISGTFIQFFNHALMKGAAFLCAGVIIYRLGTTDLKDMVGVGRKMPLTAIALTISVLALIGLPPLNGFIGELVIFTSTFEVNLGWLGIILLLNSAISAGYYLRIINTLIKPISSEKVAQAKEAPWLMIIPILALAVLIVVFGIWSNDLVAFADQAAKALLSLGGTI